MVPDQLDTGFRNRERHTTVGTPYGQTVILQGRIGGVLEGVVIHPLRCRCATPSRVHIDTEGIRVVLEQLHDTCSQLVLVLSQVGCRNRIQGLVIGKGIEVPCAILIARRYLGITAIPRRDGPCSITCPLGPQRGQSGLELGCFLGAHRRTSSTHAQRQQRNTEGKLTNFLVMHDRASERIGSIQGNEVAVAVGLLVGLDAVDTVHMFTGDIGWAVEAVVAQPHSDAFQVLR